MRAGLIRFLTLSLFTFVFYCITTQVVAEQIDNVAVYSPVRAENVIQACKAERILDKKMCLGYLKGVVDVFVVVHADLLKSVEEGAADTPYGRVCIPTWVDLEMIKKIFIQYVSENAEMSNLPASLVGYRAVKSAFPCQESEPSTSK